MGKGQEYKVGDIVEGKGYSTDDKDAEGRALKDFHRKAKNVEYKKPVEVDSKPINGGFEGTASAKVTRVLK